jgi:hypothetical protein
LSNYSATLLNIINPNNKTQTRPAFSLSRSFAFACITSIEGVDSFLLALNRWEGAQELKYIVVKAHNASLVHAFTRSLMSPPRDKNCAADRLQAIYFALPQLYCFMGTTLYPS